MKNKILLLSLFGLVTLSWFGCCKAGQGGNVDLTINVSSDSKNPIYNAVVYIKYGQSKPPANISGFDGKIQAPANSNTITFKGLKCGTYYLYASGYDSVLASPLSGGSPLSVLHKNRNKAMSTNMYIRP